MGGFNAIQSFSYNMKDREYIVRAEQAAKDLGLSFSQYMVRCIKADIGELPQKKVLGPVNPNTNESNQESADEGYKGIPAINSDRRDILDYVKQVTEIGELGKIQGNGKFMHDLSKQKIQLMKVHSVK